MDVETDLAVVIEQLPGVLAGLQREGEAFPLSFYEQGVERYLTGIRHGDEVELECMTTSLQWTADPSVEYLRTEQAEYMFYALRDSYSAAVDSVCPWLAHVPAFVKWKKIVSQGQAVVPHNMKPSRPRRR